MADKYRATIHGNTIEWEDEVPESLRGDQTIAVEVIPITKGKASRKTNGAKAAEILQKIADRGGIESIKDPVKWQREIRKDRPLPGRK